MKIKAKSHIQNNSKKRKINRIITENSERLETKTNRLTLITKKLFHLNVPEIKRLYLNSIRITS